MPPVWASFARLMFSTKRAFFLLRELPALHGGRCHGTHGTDHAHLALQLPFLGLGHPAAEQARLVVVDSEDVIQMLPCDVGIADLPPVPLAEADDQLLLDVGVGMHTPLGLGLGDAAGLHQLQLQAAAVEGGFLARLLGGVSSRYSS